MKILVVSCYGPMINNSAAIESLGYLKGLCDLKHDVHLLTVDFKENTIYYDENILKMLDKRVILHKVSAGKVFEKIVPKKNNTEEIKSNDSNNAVKRRVLVKSLKNRILIPDAYCFWVNKAYKYYLKNLEKKNFDILFSMHEPPSSHLAALKIKKRSNIKWIAYFSDPWVLDSSRNNIGIIRRKIENNLERNVIKNIDKYIFVTEGNKKDFVERYSLKESDVEILTRSYDKELYDEIRGRTEREDNGKINIVYTGEIFARLRDIKPFLDSLKFIEKKDSKLYKKLDVKFYGNIDSDYIIKYMDEIEAVTLKPRVSFKEAIREIIKSDILIIFGNKDSKQVPAKLYDYLGADSAILTIVADDNDPLNYICNEIKKCFLSKNNVLDIEKQLYNIIKNLNSGVSYKEEEGYSYYIFIKKLKNIIEK